jgi:hypothetical protein
LPDERTTVEAQKNSLAHDCLKHASEVRRRSEEFARKHPIWTKIGSMVLKGAGYLELAGIVKAGIKLGGKKMLALFGSQVLSQEVIAAVIENGTEALVDHAISHASDEQEAAEFAETAVWAVEAALAGATVIGVAGLIKDKAAVSSKLAATKVDIPTIAKAKFSQKQQLRKKSIGRLSTIADEKISNIGRQGRQARLRELMDDPNISSADRGWLKQESNSMSRNKESRPSLRVPPGKELAHRRGFEAAKGYGYEHSDLKLKADHDAQHKFDEKGKLNKDRGEK